MYQDFDPFARPERVQIMVGRVSSMRDEDPDEVVVLTLEGLGARVEGADLAEVARVPGDPARGGFKARRETRVHSWGAFAVAEFIQIHVTNVVTDALVLRALDALIGKYADRSRSGPPLTMEAARSAARQAVLLRNDPLSRGDLNVVAEEEEGGTYRFEMEGGVWVFLATVEQRKHLALVTRLKRMRRRSSG